MQRLTTGIFLALILAAATLGSAQAQYYGGNLPGGSYQQSCYNERMRGSTLTAVCTGYNGQQVRSSLNVGDCSGDIANVNGQLQCNGGDRHHHPNGNANGYYNNGNHDGNYNNGGYNVPGGSYQQSCNNERMSGSVLFASCQEGNGQWVNSSVDTRRCAGRDISNRNGYLGC